MWIFAEYAWTIFVRADLRAQAARVWLQTGAARREEDPPSCCVLGRQASKSREGLLWTLSAAGSTLPSEGPHIHPVPLNCLC